MTDKDQAPTPLDPEAVFQEVDRQRESGELAQAIREQHGERPVYGMDREKYGDQVMAYHPDGRVCPAGQSEED